MTHQVLNLQSGDAPFRADPAQSYTLPARFYHDPTVFELEKDAIFYKSWWYAGHVVGKKNVITCPYHAWAFDFDGTLKSARNTENMEGFDRSEFSLRPVQVEVFCGLVMVNKEIRHYMPSVDDLAFAQRDTYDVKSNWKVMIDNFLECYHCHTAHKDFVDLVDMPSYRSKACGIYSSHCSDAVKTTESKARNQSVVSNIRTGLSPTARSHRS